MQLSDVQRVFIQWGVIGLIISLLILCPILYGRGFILEKRINQLSRTELFDAVPRLIRIMLTAFGFVVTLGIIITLQINQQLILPLMILLTLLWNIILILFLLTWVIFKIMNSRATRSHSL